MPNTPQPAPPNPGTRPTLNSLIPPSPDPLIRELATTIFLKWMENHQSGIMDYSASYAKEAVHAATCLVNALPNKESNDQK